MTSGGDSSAFRFLRSREQVGLVLGGKVRPAKIRRTVSTCNYSPMVYADDFELRLPSFSFDLRRAEFGHQRSVRPEYVTRPPRADFHHRLRLTRPISFTCTIRWYCHEIRWIFARCSGSTIIRADNYSVLLRLLLASVVFGVRPRRGFFFCMLLLSESGCEDDNR